MGLLGFIGALLIGLSLGLLGSGGSVFTVPVLLLFFAMEPTLAIASSLLIVGAIALFGAARAWRAGLVETSVLLLFGLPAMAGAVLGSGVGALIGSQWQLAIFALLALVAAWRMVFGLQQRTVVLARAWLLPAGLVTGFFTGLVGVGGGFLIVPALVLVAGLAMRRATATSLVLIAASAFSGFAGYWFMWPEPGGPPVPWLVVAGVTVAGLVGMLAGQRLSQQLPERLLRSIFAGVLVLLSVYLISRVIAA